MNDGLAFIFLGVLGILTLGALFVHPVITIIVILFIAAGFQK